MKKIRFKQTEIGMIPEDWEVKKVEDLFQIFAGGDLSKIDFSENKSKEYRYRVYSNSLKDKGLYGFSKNYQYEPECITITGRGDVGRAECRREPFNAIVRLLVLKPKKEVSCYFFASFINIKLDFSYIGSAVNQLTAPEISQRLIAFPSIEEQKRIAKILSDLDSKIELNHKARENLEAIGLALFNKWFNIDDIPENWQTKPLDEIAEYLNGLPLQKYPAGEDEEYLPVIKIRELRNGISDQTEKANLEIPEDYIIEDGDVLFSWSGTLEVEIWTNGKGALNQHLFKVSSKEYPKWFYYYWTKHFLQKFRHIAKGKATTMGHIQRHNLTESEVIIPDKNAFEDRNKIMSPIVERLITISLESRNLERIRDLLLPKLMSGKIRVPVEAKLLN